MQRATDCAIARSLAWLCAGALVVLALLTGIAGAADAEAENARARAVLHEQLQDLGYRGPDPEISWVDKHGIVEVCGCAPKAFSRGDNIYLSRAVDLETLPGQSMVRHEAVHFLQQRKRGPAGGCDEWTRRELEATSKQNEWLSEHGSAWRSIYVGHCRD